MRWVDDWDEAGRVARRLDAGRALWKEEQAFRDRALERVRALGRDAQLQDSLHELSIIGYEKVRPPGYEKVRALGREEARLVGYERARPLGYEEARPEIDDEELARVAAGAGLWTASLSLVWATVPLVTRSRLSRIRFFPSWKSSEWATGPLVSSRGRSLFSSRRYFQPRLCLATLVRKAARRNGIDRAHSSPESSSSQPLELRSALE